ncbi:hypothetical protein F2P81_009554 [Scophthalmus maximus]|uniref:Ig-like domain-containing protein n=1 Tax=Scophthalmus maximus TaxID=52904 RepID=A0A6A4T512_SCOMX|nr:hypothetical protein F2P81_009554 [Scophthalmus maximus]
MLPPHTHTYGRAALAYVMRGAHLGKNVGLLSLCCHRVPTVRSERVATSETVRRRCSRGRIHSYVRSVCRPNCALPKNCKHFRCRVKRRTAFVLENKEKKTQARHKRGPQQQHNMICSLGGSFNFALKCQPIFVLFITSFYLYNLGIKAHQQTPGVSSTDLLVLTQTPDMSVTEGETVIITCCYTGESERITFNWQKNQTEIKNQSINLKIQSQDNLKNVSHYCSNLTLSNITGAVSGSYVCKVSVDIPNYGVNYGNPTVITVVARGSTDHLSSVIQSAAVEQDTGVVSAGVGDNVTLRCFYDSQVAMHFSCPVFTNTKNWPRSPNDEMQNNLTLKWLHVFPTSDLGAKLQELQDIPQGPESVTVLPGGSVTLNCTVNTGTCDGEHRVCWFRHGSRPGIIHAHGDQCHRVSAPAGSLSHSCVYHLQRMNLTSLDAGTYHCAMASCGEVLFGSGSKVLVTDDTEDRTAQMRFLVCLSIVRAAILVLFLTGCLSVYSTKSRQPPQS